MGFLNFLGFGKEAMIEKMSKQDMSQLLSMLPIDVAQIMQIAEKKVADWISKTQQEAGAKLLLMAELDESTRRVNIEFHKINDGTTEHWKTINLSEITNFLNNLKNAENDTNIAENNPTILAEPTTDATDNGTNTADDTATE